MTTHNFIVTKDIDKMLKCLNYHSNWLDFGFLTPQLLTLQFEKFHQGNDKNTEHFRYGCFLSFIQKHQNFSDLQIEQFIILAQQDDDNLMAGSALKMLFECGKITSKQYEFLKKELLNFGDWSVKLIEQHRLINALSSNILTAELLKECFDFSKNYQTNVLFQIIIDKTSDKDILKKFTTDDFGKKIRNLAKQKLKQLQRIENSM